MVIGLLILGLAGGVAAGIAAALMGVPWWAAIPVCVLAGNLVVAASALVRLALAPRARPARAADQAEPAGRDAVGPATRILGGMTLR